MTSREGGGGVVEIEETTVGDLDGVPVPFGNAWDDEYTGQGGAAVRGYSGVLFLPGGPVRVGAGSQVSVGGATWRVIEVVRRGGHAVARLERT